MHMAIRGEIFVCGGGGLAICEQNIKTWENMQTLLFKEPLKFIPMDIFLRLCSVLVCSV